MKYRELRQIDLEDLRSLCIANNWYTRGNCEEYSDLLNKTVKENITTADIVEMAEDIYAHSRLDSDHITIEHITNICYLIAKTCRTFFEEDKSDKLEMLKKELIGKEYSLTELDKKVIKHGYCSALEDTNLYSAIEDRNIYYTSTESGASELQIYFIVTFAYGEDECPSATIVKVIDIDLF